MAFRRTNIEYKSANARLNRKLMKHWDKTFKVNDIEDIPDNTTDMIYVGKILRRRLAGRFKKKAFKESINETSEDNNNTLKMLTARSQDNLFTEENKDRDLNLKNRNSESSKLSVPTQISPIENFKYEFKLLAENLAQKLKEADKVAINDSIMTYNKPNDENLVNVPHRLAYSFNVKDNEMSSEIDTESLKQDSDYFE